MVEVGGSNPLAPTSLFISGCRAVVSISRRSTGFSPPTLRVGVVGFLAKPILWTPFRSRSLAGRGYRIHSRLPVCLSLAVVPWFRYHGDRRDSYHRPCGSGLSASWRSRSFGLPLVAFPRFARLSNPLAPATRMIEKAAAGFSRPRLFCLRHSPGGE